MTVEPGPSRVTLTSPAEVRAALGCPHLVPPPPAPALGAGAMYNLRDAMARFSSGAAHQQRRAEVESAIDQINASELAATAAQRTRHYLDTNVGLDGGTDRAVDAWALARIVPVESMAVALGVASGELQPLVDDVDAVVGAIGRGSEVNAAMDESVNRLMTRFGDHPFGAVVAVSLLYQSVDATAALVVDMIICAHRGHARPSALRGTVRSAIETTTIGEVTIETGDLVDLRFTETELEFGAGSHACPGSDLARTIAATIVATISAAGLAPDGDDMTPGQDRPQHLRLTR